MGYRCENCEKIVAELRAELRAEFDQLRNDFVRRIEEIFDRTQAAIDEVEAQSSAAVAEVNAQNRGLLGDIDRRVQRLFDRLSERLHLPPQRTDEGPPRPH